MANETNSAGHLSPKPIGSTDFQMGYYEFLPASYSADGAPSPLLIALSGYRENGDGTPDGLAVLLRAGIPRLIDTGGWPTDRPLVVLALQHVEGIPPIDRSPCAGVPWDGSCLQELQHALGHPPSSLCTTPDEVHDFIAYAVGHYNVDPKRVYVTGLSCGAFSTWEYVAKYGGRQVAAAIPIGGEGRPAWATAGCGLGSVAIWAFHGSLDDVANPRGSIEPMTELAGCPDVSPERAKLTIYDGLFHAGWDEVYSGSRGDDVYSWMLGLSRQ